MNTCALTGANGYVGSAVRRAIEAHGWQVVPLVRKPAADGIAWSLDNGNGLAHQLRSRGVTALVHAAWDLRAVKPLDYRRANLEGSRRLFEEASAAGIRNIVFISTISAFDKAVSLYGRTKLETEKIASQFNALSVRPGLVWGDTPGGVFGAIDKAVRTGKIVPLIGSGNYAQYLVHEDDLGRAIARALEEKWRDGCAVPVTMAHPRMWLFRDVVSSCAARSGRNVKLVALPWRAVYSGLKAAEAAGLRLSFRSDSVLSLVNQNPNPDFTALDRFAIRLREYLPAQPITGD